LKPQMNANRRECSKGKEVLVVSVSVCLHFALSTSPFTFHPSHFTLLCPFPFALFPFSFLDCPFFPSLFPQFSLSPVSVKKNVDKNQIMAYYHTMKYLNWNAEKNDALKRERNLSFEEIAYTIESGKILSVEDNPSHPGQKLYIIQIDRYAVVVPFVETENEIFLKTAFPSRKYSKRFGLKEEI